MPSPDAPTARAAIEIRALAAQDLAAVVAIDAAHEGHSRRAYFERRLASALREPALHVQLAATDAHGLAGYALARRLTGEFGRPQPGLRLEIVGVRPNLREHGIGSALLQALCGYAQRHGATELRTAASWRDHGMLRWLDAMGFALAPAQIIDCAVDAGRYHPERDDAIDAAAGTEPRREIDYGAPAGNDFERLARDQAEVRAMTRADLREIVRIDRGITGRDRHDYIAARLDETMSDSAIRVSLCARRDDTVVGYLMARADLGDFGRTEPTAIIDTIGVDPEYAGRGIGHALLSQLFANLGALAVERVETLLEPRDVPLLGFLYRCGFRPAQRLPFVRSVA